MHAGDFDLTDRPGVGFRIGFSVLRDPVAAASPESPGTWRWGGVYGHSWFVDRARGLAVVSQSNTLYEDMNGQYTIDLRDAVYGAGSREGLDCCAVRMTPAAHRRTFVGHT